MQTLLIVIYRAMFGFGRLGGKTVRTYQTVGAEVGRVMAFSFSVLKANQTLSAALSQRSIMLKHRGEPK